MLMEKDDKQYQDLLDILHEELIPAMGCTEPIAVAYASAKAREVLGKIPDHIIVQVSNSIIKNVKSVIVPNTGNLKGVAASAAAGVVAGDASKKLEVIANVDSFQRDEIEKYLKTTPIDVEYLERGHIFDMIITVFAGNESAEVQITDYHTNITEIAKNGKIIFKSDGNEGSETPRVDRSFMNMKTIWDFALSVDMNDIQDTIGKQVEYNSAISEEGLKDNFGVNIGKLILSEYGKLNENVAAASSAAGSDARMSGCEMPVIINSGSGNQGLASSMPVVAYAKKCKCSEEKMYRALVLSNLTTIYQKNGIGTLSAYCGVVSAGVGAAAGISYLKVGTFDACDHTISNSLGISSGIICDGAKPSCAAKSALAVETGLLGLNMYCSDNNLKAGDGIVGSTADETIHNVWNLASKGMARTNEEIIDIMLGKESNSSVNAKSESQEGK
ncbi:MAG: L-serine ammonia-lyase, iron-sulfur-dependent, subunit alpha [Erysipelotrichaceae bacterium]|nr:L-serine ammonia-lyase, iron-sulfur-dependent, subunit alpha [Erysipelotrichaceae bacterium]MCH4122993.1 L-serine ammonia-lyase, iron-sulfur-dependent, subunit alpha [Erysipelotrichaceae bacterium]MCI1384694.1 L-serine ammonia-lyase, iron-sulfur-dependent, subunit alpha [Solobacterium sp.]